MLEQDERNFDSSIVPRNRKRDGFFSEVQFAEVLRGRKARARSRLERDSDGKTTG